MKEMLYEVLYEVRCYLHLKVFIVVVTAELSCATSHAGNENENLPS